MEDLTGFQRDLLYVIAGLDDPHGLAIKDELETYYEKEIHHGRLYSNLDTLVDKGFVGKGQHDN
jgi:PadR family transcriptional regulator, regulatory protein PadR